MGWADDITRPGGGEGARGIGGASSAPAQRPVGLRPAAAAMTQGPGGRAPPAPPEPEGPTTFCALLPRMPQWKFAAPAGFLGRGPAATRAAGGAGTTDPQPEPAGPAGVPALAAAVLGACEPRCAAPCPLPALSRCRTAGPRGPRGAAGAASAPDAAAAAAAEWVRKGSFIHKPAQGWLHPDARVLGPGVSYIVRYMGCIEVLRSMRSLDFNTRTQVTREAINRLHEAVPGVRGSWKKKAPNKGLASVLGKSNLRFAGMSVAVSISVDGLNLSVPATRQIIANHHMQSISFASGGDTDMTDYVAYVAKDPINQRACHILECCEGLAQSVISTVGQAFELRFKQYLHSPPKVVVPLERLSGPEESAWGDEEELEHNYYNSIPGKEPPLGGLVDSRLALSQPCALGALGQGAFSTRRDTRGLQWDLGPSGMDRRSPDSRGVQLSSLDPGALLCPRGQLASFLEGSRLGGSGRLLPQGRLHPCEPCPASLADPSLPPAPPGPPGDGYVQADAGGPQDYEDHLYVNTQGLDAPPEPLQPEDSPKKDLFDMRPFEDALKLHECSLAAGSAAAPLPLEDQWPSPPTRRAPIAPTEEQLRQEPWYHGQMSRRAAEKLLRADGDFLVRDSVTNPGQYVLTGMHAGQPKHLLLVDPEGVVRGGAGPGGGRGQAGGRGGAREALASGADAVAGSGGSPARRVSARARPDPPEAVQVSVDLAFDPRGGADLGVLLLQVRTKDVLFESISHLIDYHLQNGQPIVAAESELHLRGVVKREP
ncbi:SHC-transforming protein 2 [Galemys pyrenaicus]|uniref:SHC-transforming protein 2 n=1 Tax=Galemys pyrenaicus TaxID=202257 RepID=A0A8J6ADU3_GALPY|nr:SHC-transforming protein 2 [Galemys pyrenaicus]